MSTKIQQLKIMIKQELGLCDAETTPQLCEMKEHNYEKVERMIIQRVAKGGQSINSAMVNIEREFNQETTDL